MLFRWGNRFYLLPFSGNSEFVIFAVRSKNNLLKASPGIEFRLYLQVGINKCKFADCHVVCECFGLGEFVFRFKTEQLDNLALNVRDSFIDPLVTNQVNSSKGHTKESTVLGEFHSENCILMHYAVLVSEFQVDQSD